jgi:hypothetical protein
VRLRRVAAGAASETGTGRENTRAVKAFGWLRGVIAASRAHGMTRLSVHPVSVPRVTRCVTRVRFLGGKKVAFCSVMTTDSSSVRVPPRKGEHRSEEPQLLPAVQVLGGRKPAARSPAAAYRRE